MLNLDQSKTIIEAVLKKGAEMKLQPLSVAILDPGGHLIAFERQNQASIMRPQIALGKAAGALALGLSSRKVAEMAEARPTFIASLGEIWPNGVVPAAGGLIIEDDSGAVLGAIGVTGDTSDQDEAAAISAIESAGLSVGE